MSTKIFLQFLILLSSSNLLGMSERVIQLAKNWSLIQKTQDKNAVKYEGWGALEGISIPYASYSKKLDTGKISGFMENEHGGSYVGGIWTGILFNCMEVIYTVQQRLTAMRTLLLALHPRAGLLSPAHKWPIDIYREIFNHLKTVPIESSVEGQ